MRARSVVVVASLLSCGACSSGTSPSTTASGLGSSPAGSDAASDPCGGNDPAFVFYAVGNDFFPAEACRQLIAAEAAGQVTNGGPTAPTWAAPSQGSTLAGDDWVVASWLVPAGAPPATDGGDANGGAPVLVDGGDAPATNDDAASGDVDGYVVEFDYGGAELLRVMLEGTEWPIDFDSWTLLKSVPGPLVGTVIRVKIDGTSLDTSTPPVAGAPVTFTISM